MRVSASNNCKTRELSQPTPRNSSVLAVVDSLNTTKTGYAKNTRTHHTPDNPASNILKGPQLWAPHPRITPHFAAPLASQSSHHALRE